MAKIAKYCPIILILLASANFAQAQTQPDMEPSRILALESSWNQAVQQKDRPSLDLLLGPDLIYVDYDGKLMSKTEYVASVLSKELHPARISSEGMNVHFYGSAAVVNGVYRESGMKNGKPYLLRERFTDTWISRGKSWICVASHSTLVGQ